MTNHAYWLEQTVLITGSSRGIGRALAMHFSLLGCKVAINYSSNEEKAKETLALCNSKQTRIYKADVGNENDVNKMIEAIESELGEITILINNAGVTKDGLMMAMSTEDWRAVMNTHLDGAFFCSRAVMRNMVRKRYGRIINITSVSGIKGTAGQVNYSAAKAGLIGFTKALAREMGKKKITTNAIALGLIETDMTSTLDESVLDQYKQMTSLKRFGTPDEVCKLAEYLASSGSSYMTGQVLTLDGGIL